MAGNRTVTMHVQHAINQFKPPLSIAVRSVQLTHRRNLATRNFSHPFAKREGDISSVFPSLSEDVIPPPPSRFADLKSRLIAGYEDAVQVSWHELLSKLKEEIEAIRALGSGVVPEISYSDINDVARRTRFRDSLKKRGIAVVRGVISESEALGWKELVKRYIKSNPGVRGRFSLLGELYPKGLVAFSFLPTSPLKHMVLGQPHEPRINLRLRQEGDSGTVGSVAIASKLALAAQSSPDFGNRAWNWPLPSCSLSSQRHENVIHPWKIF